MTTRLDTAIQQLREAFADEVGSQYETRLDRNLAEALDAFYGIDITSDGVAFRDLQEPKGEGEGVVFTVAEAKIAADCDWSDRYTSFTEALASMTGLPTTSDVIVEERIRLLVRDGGILHIWDDQVSWSDGHRVRSAFRIVGDGHHWAAAIIDISHEVMS